MIIGGTLVLFFLFIVLELKNSKRKLMTIKLISISVIVKIIGTIFYNNIRQIYTLILKMKV